jgi:hypothetical protein
LALESEFRGDRLAAPTLLGALPGHASPAGDEPFQNGRESYPKTALLPDPGTQAKSRLPSFASLLIDEERGFSPQSRRKSRRHLGAGEALTLRLSVMWSWQNRPAVCRPATLIV